MLETGSPRFSSPGAFFTYVLFVCTVIVVSYRFLFFFLLSSLETSHICPPSVNLAEAVPGSEEDHRLHLMQHIIRFNPFTVFVCVGGMLGMPIR